MALVLQPKDALRANSTWAQNYGSDHEEWIAVQVSASASTSHHQLDSQAAEAQPPQVLLRTLNCTRCCWDGATGSASLEDGRMMLRVNATGQCVPVLWDPPAGRRQSSISSELF